MCITYWEHEVDFGNAVKMMKQGLEMTRTSWDNQKSYVYLDGELFMKKQHDISKPFPVSFYAYELLATDWEVVRVHGGSPEEAETGHTESQN